MILENKWYESEQVKTEGFFKDSAGRTKEKITYFPKMYYRLKKWLDTDTGGNHAGKISRPTLTLGKEIREWLVL